MQAMPDHEGCLGWQCTACQGNTAGIEAGWAHQTKACRPDCPSRAQAAAADDVAVPRRAHAAVRSTPPKPLQRRRRSSRARPHRVAVTAQAELALLGWQQRLRHKLGPHTRVLPRRRLLPLLLRSLLLLLRLRLLL